MNQFSNATSEIAIVCTVLPGNFSALIVFLFPHASLISPWKLQKKGEKEVGIDASFRLIRGMICWGVSEINQSECGIRIQGRAVGLCRIQICDIMHEIMVKKEAIPLNHDDTLLWHSPSVLPRTDGCTLYVCMCANKNERSCIRCHDVTGATEETPQLHV